MLASIRRSRTVVRILGSAAATLGAATLLSACGPLGETPTDPAKAAKELSAGLSSHAAGKLDEATTHYKAALAADPKNKYALYDLALIDMVNKRSDDAEAKYRIAVAIDPNYGPALFNLALIVKGQGRTDEALDLYRRAVTADPKNASAHLNYGIMLRAKGERVEGDAEVKQALTLDASLKDPAVASTVTKAPTTSGVK